MFDIANEKIGIFLSGGMDSALLLYLLATKNYQVLQPLTVPKHDGARYYVDSIVEWVSRRVEKKIEPPVILGDPNLRHDQILSHAIGRSIHHNLSDCFFLADNRYDETVLPNGPVRIQHGHAKIHYPFFHLYKTDIVNMYVSHGLMELLPLTHTCTEQAVGRCRVCWQCRERQWAFDESGVVDDSTT